MLFRFCLMFSTQVAFCLPFSFFVSCSSSAFFSGCSRIRCPNHSSLPTLKSFLVSLFHFSKMFFKQWRTLGQILGGQAYCFGRMTSHISIVLEQKNIVFQNIGRAIAPPLAPSPPSVRHCLQGIFFLALLI